MSYIVICGASLVVSALTCFSGFGLGTLLVPAFAIFVPLEQAVASTAAMRLLRGAFTVLLVGRMLVRVAIGMMSAAR